MAYPIQPVQFFDAGNALRTGLDAAAQLQKSQLLREENQQRQAAQQFIAPALQGDVGALGRLIMGDPRAAQIVGNTTQQMAERQKDLQKLQLQFADDTIASLEGASEADRATVYAQRRAEAERRGWPVTMWPQQYSQPWHQIEKSRVIGIKEQYQQQQQNWRHQTPSPNAPNQPPVWTPPPQQPPPVAAPPPQAAPAPAPPVAAPGTAGPVAQPPAPQPQPVPAQPPMRVTPQLPSQRTSMAPMGDPNVMQASYSPAGQSGPATWGPAIRNIESGSAAGNYQAVGPVTMVNGRPARPYGAYQVMDFNVGPWTREVLGVEMTPQQFLASKPAQDLVFNAKFGQFVAQSGSPQDAASIWFTGQPRSRAGGGARDVLGTSNDVYQARFNAGLGGQGGAPAGGPGQMPVYGQQGSGGAGNGPGVAPAVYALPETYTSAALRPGAVYNDGSGRAEPGGPVLGPASGGGNADQGFIPVQAQQTVPLPPMPLPQLPPLSVPQAPPAAPAPAAPAAPLPSGQLTMTPQEFEASGGIIGRDPRTGAPMGAPDGSWFLGRRSMSAPPERIALPKPTERPLPSVSHMWIDPANPRAGETPIPNGPADPAVIERNAALKRKQEADAKPLTADQEKRLTAVPYETLKGLVEGFKQSFGGYGNDLVGDLHNLWKRNAADWMGGGDPDGQALWWQRYNEFANIKRNELFGATLTPAEISAFNATMASPGQRPEVIAANLGVQRDIAALALSRIANSMAKGGISREVIEARIGVPLSSLPDPMSSVSLTPKQGPAEKARDEFNAKKAGGDPLEGRTATNPQTKEKMIRRGGQWVPVQ